MYLFIGMYIYTYVCVYSMCIYVGIYVYIFMYIYTFFMASAGSFRSNSCIATSLAWDKQNEQKRWKLVSFKKRGENWSVLQSLQQKEVGAIILIM